MANPYFSFLVSNSILHSIVALCLETASVYPSHTCPPYRLPIAIVCYIVLWVTMELEPEGSHLEHRKVILSEQGHKGGSFRGVILSDHS